MRSPQYDEAEPNLKKILYIYGIWKLWKKILPSLFIPSLLRSKSGVILCLFFPLKTIFLNLIILKSYLCALCKVHCNFCFIIFLLNFLIENFHSFFIQLNDHASLSLGLEKIGPIILIQNFFIVCWELVQESSFYETFPKLNVNMTICNTRLRKKESFS